MTRRLVELLACPACGQSLSLHAISEKPEEVRCAVTSPRCSSHCALLNVAVDANAARFDCRECYSRDVREGFLACSGCKMLFPIIDGVPRLVRHADVEHKEFFFRHRHIIEQLAGQQELVTQLSVIDPRLFHRRSNESFSLQWEQHQDSDRTWFKDDASLRREEFLRSLDVDKTELRGALVLDAGCGNGRLTASVALYGAEVVGMDLSRSVVRANEHRAAIAGAYAPFVHFVQGNVLEPPFRAETFDHIHTSGALHHTPDTWRAFRSFLRLGRTGGKVYVQLYRKREFWVRLVNTPLRFVTCRLPLRLLYRLCYVMVPVHTALVLLVARARGERSPIRSATRGERALSLFDHLSPRYQFRYTADEVRQQFSRAGLRGIKDVTFENEARQMVAFVGVK